MNISSNNWLYHIRQWHWISSALCLAGLLFFAITGITLNRASLFKAQASTTHWEKSLPVKLSQKNINEKTLPSHLSKWLASQTGYKVSNYTAQWSSDEIYIAMASPGADAWVSIDPSTQKAEFEQRSLGLISFINDLHKGRHTGKAWQLFIDIFAIACIIFSATGLFLLMYYQKQRKTTWPFVSTGLVIPIVLILLFIHF